MVPVVSSNVRENEVNSLYDSGINLTAIAIRTGIPFGDVFAAVSATHPGRKLDV